VMAARSYFSARPREGADPESKELDSRFRGNERSRADTLQ
jgi:hypothetical protein